MGVVVCGRCMARELERVGGKGTGSQRASGSRYWQVVVGGVAVRRGCCVGRLRCG